MRSAKAAPKPWDVIYYRASDGSVPASAFLDICPPKVHARFLAVIDDVAVAPPPRFSGGGYWEAMHGSMAGYYEVRQSGPSREQFRLFCILENGSPEELGRRGLPGPAIALITGMRKPWMTKFSGRDYRRVLDLGTEHLAQYPRRIKES